MAEGVKNNTVPPLFMNNLTVIHLTKYIDFNSVTGKTVSAYCKFGLPLKRVFTENSSRAFTDRTLSEPHFSSYLSLS